MSLRCPIQLVIGRNHPARLTVKPANMKRFYGQARGFCSRQSGGFPFNKTTTTTTSDLHGLNLNLSNNNNNNNRIISTCKRTLTSQVIRPYVDPKLSYAYGKSAEELIYSTVDRELAKRVEESPDEIAFACDADNKLVSFKHLDRDINRLTKALIKKFGVGKGDFVGVFAYNCYNWILVELACSRIGAILSPINPSYKAHELAYVLKKGQIKCLFMPGPKSVQAELNNHMQVLHSDEVIQATREKSLKLENVILLDGENEYSTRELDDQFKLHNCKLNSWQSIEDQNDGQIFKSLKEVERAGVNEDDALILDPNFHVSPDDLFAVYYTSGTTGLPKGACVSQFTVLNNTRFCQFRLRNGRPRTWRAISATALPMFHIFAGVLNTLSPCVSNTMIVYPSYKYDIGAFVDSVMRHQANITTLTPTMLIDLLTHVEQRQVLDIPLKLIQPGGASLPPELVSRTFKVLPNVEELRGGYGSTENGAVSTFQTIHEPMETRSFTVGPPIDFTEVRVVETNGSDRVVPLGVQGEVQTRGHNTMIEYLDDARKTEEVLTPSRWYKTGDIGIMHPHGSLQICGRLKQMIIKGGENIYPQEVEQMMHKMECIEKVHVVGVPDKRFGEQVCAWIKLKPGFAEKKDGRVLGDNKAATPVSQEDVLEFCKENITYFKVPRYILFVDDFPMTPTKKAQLHLMVEKSIELLGLDREVTRSN